jgi:hypothetical protein
MIIQHARFVIEIDHKGFVYMDPDENTGDHLEWSELSDKDEAEVLAIRASGKALLERAEALYSKVTGKLKN